MAASTHGRDFAAHPADGAPLLTGISLHGCFISIPMPRDRQRIPLSLPVLTTCPVTSNRVVRSRLPWLVNIRGWMVKSKNRRLPPFYGFQKVWDICRGCCLKKELRIRAAASSPAIFVLAPTNAPIGATPDGSSFSMGCACGVRGSIPLVSDGTAKRPCPDTNRFSQTAPTLRVGVLKH